MKPNEYQEWTRTVAIYNPEIERDYLILGLADEARELAEVIQFRNIPGIAGDWVPSSYDELWKEGGDCCWFVARLADNFFEASWQQFDFDDVVNFQDITDFALDFLQRTQLTTRKPQEDLQTILKLSCELCGLHAKAVRDNSGYWDEQKISKVLPILRLIMINLIRVLHTYGSNLGTILEMNHQKLESRKQRNVLGGSGDHR